jgi:signal transduction histidine kinase
MDLETLAKENASLNEQVKLLARVEKRLYHTQNNLELQLRRIRALNDFALAAMRPSSQRQILSQAIELLCPLYGVQSVVAVLYPDPDTAPIALTWLIDGDVTAADVPASLVEPPALDAVNRSYLVTEAPREPPIPPIAPIVAWLDEVSAELEGDLQRYLVRDVVLTIGAETGATRAILAFRSASLGNLLTVAGEADLPFLEVVCQHVARTMDMSVLHATLEQRVAERTLALRDSNAQLAESLEHLRSTQRQLLEASRKAGMSEIATSVLHNVGNVLNSVNVSTSLVEERAAQLKLKGLARVADLLHQHGDDLPRFFAEDPRAANLPGYLQLFASTVEADQQHMLAELALLRRNVDHIKAIIMLQQDLAKSPRGVAEPLSIVDVIEDALCFDRPAYERFGIAVERQFEPLDEVIADRHKILQILTNLLSNARHALAKQPAGQRRVVIRVLRRDADHVIEIEDSGCGIPAENLGRVFNLGFTTRADGHGFGLHSSACAAAELGGSLSCHSDGADRGARFRLALPLAAAAR